MIKNIKEFWKKETIGTKVCAVLLSITAVLYLISKFTNNGNEAKEVNIITTTSSYDVVEYVKESYLEGYEVFTIGQCVEGYLHNAEWNAYIDTYGNKYISAIGDVKKNISSYEESKQCINFYIDSNSTEIIFTGLCYEDGTRYAEGYDDDYYPYVERIFNGGFMF